MRPILLNSILVGLIGVSAAMAAGEASQSRRLALVGGKVYPSPDAAPVDDAVVIVD